MANQNEKQKVLTKKHVARLERERQQVKIVWTIAMVTTILVAVLLSFGFIKTRYLDQQQPVAEINGEKITLQEWQERVQLQNVNMRNLYQRYQFFQQQFGMDVSQQLQELDYYLNTPDAIGQLVLDQMVDEALIRQEAKKRDITVSEQEVEQAIQEDYRFFPDGTPTPTITPTAFGYPTLTSKQLTIYPSTATPTKVVTSTPEATATPDKSATATSTFTAAPPTPTFVPEDVPATATPFTMEGYKGEYQKTMDQYKSYGIKEKTFRSVYESEILKKKLLAVITADQPTSEQQVWARHILVDTETEAQDAYAKLIAGAEFAELAKEISKDTGSGAQGGDLGWFAKGAMVAEFEAAAFSQAIGEIGEPVKSQFGYHIIQVLDRQDLPLSESTLQQKRESAFTEWLTTFRDGATITRFDELWKASIPPTPQVQAPQQ